MAGDMEVDPAAVQAFATFLADARAQLEQVRARVAEPSTSEDDLGRHWKGDGEEYVNAYSMIAPDLGALSALLDQVSTQLTAGADLQVAGEATNLGAFTKIAAGGDTESPTSESGGI
ncbi:WXG100 family type VII secretion target [Actinophytocola oryzae]|uniref:Uncharacterized protein YukE n=1 Tax=Actinophytocola oryzae TaxID=502181 RepID=A0A4R7VDP9_9PSEU|nr:hypothetical protein [Actinophytocola oryzae]TDV47175.1 uncharacterized protein YukE [Actinophytocola oryzae]